VTGHRLCPGQDGGYWTTEERAKGVYIAERAMRLGKEPVMAVVSYMGMNTYHAQICVKRAEQRRRGEARRK
jgi:hypothetical protein